MVFLAMSKGRRLSVAFVHVQVYEDVAYSKLDSTRKVSLKNKKSEILYEPIRESIYMIPVNDLDNLQVVDSLKTVDVFCRRHNYHFYTLKVCFSSDFIQGNEKNEFKVGRLYVISDKTTSSISFSSSRLEAHAMVSRNDTLKTLNTEVFDNYIDSLLAIGLRQ